MINGGVINGAPINSSQVFGDGKAWDAEQSVALLGSGSLWTAEQTVNLRLSGSGSLFTVEQIVANTVSGSLWKAEQTVKQAGVVTHTDRHGWDATLIIGGVEIARNTIHGNINITRNENSAALMNVTLINLEGIQDFAAWHGKKVLLDIETASGIDRAYTGWVDIPVIDLIAKTITLRCTDKRKEQVNEQLAGELQFIGKWSDAIFNEVDDTAAELAHRLKTTTQTVDFDQYGNYTVSDYLPKATADFTLADADIYRRTPSVQVASRGRLINQVNIEFEYRFTRLRHRSRSFEITTPTFCEYMTIQGLKWMSTGGVNSTIDGFGWTLKDDSKSFTFLPPPGWYDCGQGKFGWLPIVYEGKVVILRDEEGNAVTDANGNPYTETINSNTTDLTEGHILGTTWTAEKKFSQYVTEKINIEVNAPQSQAQYGTIAKPVRHSMNIDYDDRDYEEDKPLRLGFSGDSDLKPTDDVYTETDGDSYFDKSGSAVDYNNALITVLSMAETTIKKTHRDNHVSIQVPIWPEIDLKHTVATTAGIIQCKGKVSKITHTLNISTGFSETACTLSLSRAEGSQADETLSFPILNIPLIGEKTPVSALKFKLYEKLGSNPVLGEGVRSPDIDDESREAQIVESNYSINIGIQNNDLVVTF